MRLSHSSRIRRSLTATAFQMPRRSSLCFRRRVTVLKLKRSFLKTSIRFRTGMTLKRRMSSNPSPDCKLAPYRRWGSPDFLKMSEQRFWRRSKRSLLESTSSWALYLILMDRTRLSRRNSRRVSNYSANPVSPK